MPKKQETKIQDRVRLELSKKGCKVFRCNVGNFYTKYGQEIKIGTPGHSDLYGVKPGGIAFFKEMKTPIGKASDQQKKFIQVMKQMGCCAGFANSVDQAIKIVFPKNEE